MSNPTVSFRISDYHLARGLRAIRAIEPAWKLTTTSDLIRTIFNDYIAKSEHINNHPLNVTLELLEEIALTRANGNQNQQLDTLPQLRQIKQKSPEQIQRDLEDEKLFKELRQQSIQQKEVKDSQTAQQIEIFTSKTMNKAPKELDTESKITTVRDFSPPDEWKDQ